MLFRLHAYRFTFTARSPLFFPPGKAGNVFRGALGTCFRGLVCDPSCEDSSRCPIEDCPYARLFTPKMADGPSGLADAPRPFVLRASHLDGVRVASGERFDIVAHVFDLRSPVVQYFALAFTRLLDDGLGPGRGSVELSGIDASGQTLFAGGGFVPGDHPEPLALDLAPGDDAVHRIRVTFLTPTEIKSAGSIASEPDFPSLLARVRDRIGNLRALYGDGPLTVDYRAQNEGAATVQLTSCRLTHEDVSRFSTRTRQQHPLGGFTGIAEYHGDALREFLPYLKAGEYTGVGRQTVWGKGAYRVEVLG